MTDVTPFLWFDDDAEAAIMFYTALIPDSEVVSIGRYPDEVPGMGGKVMHAHFRLAGRDYYAMDAGPAVPVHRGGLAVRARAPTRRRSTGTGTALTADGGQEQPCAWLKDRWGLSWQIVPDRLIELIRDPDPDRSHRAVQAMLHDDEDRHRRDRSRRRRIVSTLRASARSRMPRVAVASSASACAPPEPSELGRRRARPSTAAAGDAAPRRPTGWWRPCRRADDARAGSRRRPGRWSRSPAAAR